MKDGAQTNSHSFAERLWQWLKNVTRWLWEPIRNGWLSWKSKKASEHDDSSRNPAHRSTDCNPDDLNVFLREVPISRGGSLEDPAFSSDDENDGNANGDGIASQRSGRSSSVYPGDLRRRRASSSPLFGPDWIDVDEGAISSSQHRTTSAQGLRLVNRQLPADNRVDPKGQGPALALESVETPAADEKHLDRNEVLTIFREGVCSRRSIGVRLNPSISAYILCPLVNAGVFDGLTESAFAGNNYQIAHNTFRFCGAVVDVKGLIGDISRFKYPEQLLERLKENNTTFRSYLLNTDRTSFIWLSKEPTTLDALVEKFTTPFTSESSPPTYVPFG